MRWIRNTGIFEFQIISKCFERRPSIETECSCIPCRVRINFGNVHNYTNNRNAPCDVLIPFCKTIRSSLIRYYYKPTRKSTRVFIIYCLNKLCLETIFCVRTKRRTTFRFTRMKSSWHTNTVFEMSSSLKTIRNVKQSSR